MRDNIFHEIKLFPEFDNPIRRKETTNTDNFLVLKSYIENKETL